MPLSPSSARWLAEQGHDAVHASTIGLSQASDETIVARAAADGRIIVTADLDYPKLLWLMRAESPGVILFRGGVHAEDEIIARLGEVLRKFPAEELARAIVVVDRDRVRRRRLPLR